MYHFLTNYQLLNTLGVSFCVSSQVFLDLGDRYLVRPELIKQGKLLGRGGFGFVFQGACRNRASGAPMDVALKMLQPVDPGTSARQSAIVAYKVVMSVSFSSGRIYGGFHSVEELLIRY